MVQCAIHTHRHIAQGADDDDAAADDDDDDDDGDEVLASEIRGNKFQIKHTTSHSENSRPRDQRLHSLHVTPYYTYIQFYVYV